MAEFSETPISEIILRKYETPHNLNKRETLKKICLMLGLLQPGDSRDVIVDILYILERNKRQKKGLSSQEIRDNLIDIRKRFNLSLNGTAESNIRRQLKRLRDIFLVEKVKNYYRVREFLPLKDIFEKQIKDILLKSILERNEEFFNYYNEKFETYSKKKEDKKNEK